MSRPVCLAGHECRERAYCRDRSDEEYIQMQGAGHNALDFHIAYYLGLLVWASGRRVWVPDLQGACGGLWLQAA